MIAVASGMRTEADMLLSNEAFCPRTHVWLMQVHDDCRSPKGPTVDTEAILARWQSLATLRRTCAAPERHLLQFPVKYASSERRPPCSPTCTGGILNIQEYWRNSNDMSRQKRMPADLLIVRAHYPVWGTTPF